MNLYSTRRLSFREKVILQTALCISDWYIAIGGLILVPNKVGYIEQIGIFVSLEEQTQHFEKRITIKHICEWKQCLQRHVDSFH